jgi:diguanylate cyclase (GGDEF)-like protein
LLNAGIRLGEGTSVDFGSKGSLRTLLVPGGLWLGAAVVLFQGGFLSISPAVVDFYYYAVFAAGILLAWRFHSSRVVFALVMLLLAHRSIEFFAMGRAVSAGPGRIAFEAIAFLLPVNFIVLSFIRERGLAVPFIASRLGLLFVESVFVAVLCRPGQTVGPALLHGGSVGQNWLHWAGIPQLSLLAFLLAWGILLARFLLYRKPVEAGLLWSLAAAFLALQSGGVGRTSSAYLATGALILVSSIIENSYVLAYHDELTSLPARRAFNESLLQLEAPYAIAVVDIDHFKSFNDAHGHETGDQVLRMVAASLARVTGGGKAFRVGGEEFSILFSGKSVKEVAPHLESLRTAIEESRFRVRGGEERRSATRGPDRRTAARKKGSRASAPAQVSDGKLSVTVSMGVAEATPHTQEVEQVIQAADKALYRAKQSGRNRVEIAGAPRTRTSRLKRGIA